MTNQEVLDKLKEQYDKAKSLAKDMWDITDSVGNANDRYYFECGFIAGLACGLKKNLEKED